MADIYAYRDKDVTHYISFNDDGTAANWYNPSQGQIDQVKAAIEAHFNIELTQTAMATGVVNMGEILPDWDTYEKIQLPSNNKFRFKPSGSSAYVAGFVENENAFIYTDDTDKTWRLGPEGQIWGSFGTISDLSTQAKQLLLNEYGIEFDVIDAYVENWEEGQTIPNWESYKTLE